jgi:ComF family protein
MRFASSFMPDWLSNWSPHFIDQCLNFTHHLLPQQCLLCTANAAQRPLCDACHAQLPVLTPVRCPQCATPTPRGELCGACLADPPAFHAVTAAYRYAWPLATLIQQFKYSGNLALARVLAESIVATERAPVDLIVPMPLGPARLRERGFNQALELARFAGAQTRTPIAVDACRRVDDRPPQASLPWRERAKNIRGAFIYNADLSGKRIAVVDDVMTTGATMHEIARTLRKAGAAEVHGWVVARTLKKS